MIEEDLIDKAEKEIDNGLQEANKDVDGKDIKKSPVQKIIELLDSAGVTFFLDEDAEPNAVLPDKPLVAYPVASTVFKRYLRRLFWESCSLGLSSETIIQVLGTLEGRTDSQGKKLALYNRIARVSGKIYFDLGDDKQAIEIDSDGWRLADPCPVKFRRFKHQLPQVMPVDGGDWQEVLKYVNLRDPLSQLLFLTYVPAILIPDIPRAILVCAGDQGAAKSTALRVARSLVDPSSADLASPARDIMELGQAANHNYCLYLDNMSPLNEELSDALCRLTTGIGFNKRKLYTDSDDVLFNQKVAIGLTGINVVAQKPDILDRCLILNFERISDDKRLEEEHFWRQFNEEKPLLLGALFNILSGVLKRAPSVVLERKPRMADYARYAAAAAIELGQTTETFITAFGENTKRQNNASIESSSTAQVILEFMKDKDNWEGASSELYSLLKQIIDKTNLQIGGSGGFPKAANWLWRKIKEVRPNLQALGIEAVCSEASTNSIIHLYKLAKNAATVASSLDVSIEQMSGKENGAAIDVATGEASKFDLGEEAMAAMATTTKQYKCTCCGSEDFWTRFDGEPICSLCHPPVDG